MSLLQNVARPTVSRRSIAKRVAAYLGLDVYRVRRESSREVISGFSHLAIVPSATYSPWLDDEGFQAIWKLVTANTLVDRYRCYELWQLVQQIAHLPGDILEVGVWRGGTGAVIAKAAALAAPTKTVYLADTFTGVVKTSATDVLYEDGRHADASEEIVRSLLSKCSLSNAQIVVGIFPEDHPGLADQQFCFVHVDVDIYQSAADIVAAVWPRLPMGGVVVFDDYGNRWTSGITTLVRSYIGQPDRLVIYNLNGHAVMVKTTTS